MVNINLMPWIKQRQHYEQRALKKLICICFLLCLILILSVHYTLEKYKTNLDNRINAMQTKFNLIKNPVKYQQHLISDFKNKLSYQKGVNSLFFSLGTDVTKNICFL